MRIAIDASTLSTQGGPRAYVLGLLEALLKADLTNDYIIFYNDPCHLGRFPGAKEIVLSGKSPLARLWREHVLIPLACKRERIDLLHCPKSAIPYLSPGCPVVVTLHDLIPIMHPEWETFAARTYWRLQMPVAARRSDFIITISEYACRDITQMYSVPEDRIRVVMNGFNPRMAQHCHTDHASAVKAKYGLPDDYILYVGTIQPRKNIDTLIEAFAALKCKHEINQKLVIAGRKGWLYDELFARIAELGLENDIIFTGFVPDEDLPCIYQQARLFVYLSLCEGFGIPPLEAMACGVPVIASNTSAIPEVIGDAGITVPPENAEQVADAILRVLRDNDLAANMSNLGKVRAAQFSWDQAARQTLAIYQQVYENKHQPSRRS